jgi:hypothetical protein
MYDGPIIDSFFHSPWIGSHDGPVQRADVVPWTDDRRLRRVMHTFHHGTDPGGAPPSLSLDEVLQAMDRSGVTHGILCAKVYYPSTRDQLDRLHQELAALSARSASRLKWVATILPPAHGSGTYWDLMEGPHILSAIKGLPGLVGVHITPSPWGLAPNDRWYYPLYARCVDLGLTLFSYVGAPGPLWPMEPNNPRHLDDVALAFPDLRIVAHHIGDPWTDMVVRLAARHANVIICTSAWSPKAYPRELTDFMQGHWHGTKGCERVMFASDYPLMDLDRTVKAARALDLTVEQARRVLHDNAHEWFFA